MGRRAEGGGASSRGAGGEEARGAEPARGALADHPPETSRNDVRPAKPLPRAEPAPGTPVLAGAPGPRSGRAPPLGVPGSAGPLPGRHVHGGPYGRPRAPLGALGADGRRGIRAGDRRDSPSARASSPRDDAALVGIHRYDRGERDGGARGAGGAASDRGADRARSGIAPAAGERARGPGRLRLPARYEGRGHHASDPVPDGALAPELPDRGGGRTEDRTSLERRGADLRQRPGPRTIRPRPSPVARRAPRGIRSRCSARAAASRW